MPVDKNVGISVIFFNLRNFYKVYFIFYKKIHCLDLGLIIEYIYINCYLFHFSFIHNKMIKKFITCKTYTYKYKFHLHCILDWNKDDLFLSHCCQQIKCKWCAIMRNQNNPIKQICWSDPPWISLLKICYIIYNQRNFVV